MGGPADLSLIMAMRLSVSRKPWAMRMVTLILLLNASIPALEQPSLMVVRMSSRRLRIFPHGSTISGMRRRDARPIHRLSSASARSTGWRRSSLSCHER